MAFDTSLGSVYFYFKVSPASLFLLFSLATSAFLSRPHYFGNRISNDLSTGEPFLLTPLFEIEKTSELSFLKVVLSVPRSDSSKE